MKFLKCFLVGVMLITVAPTMGYAHPPTEENKLDKLDCHYTSGAGGNKHYHRNNDFQAEYPCTELPDSFLNNPFFIGIGFFIAGISGALILALFI